MPTKAPTFFSEVTEAVNHFKQYGFTSQNQIDQWVARLRRAAMLQLRTPAETERELKRVLTDRYRGMVTQGGLLREMPEVKRISIDRIKPRLRAELDRRIMASANLIKLNRQQAIDKTLQRFQGWATSVLPGGSRAVEVKTEKDDIRKSLSQMDFIERRVVVDQTHKFVATVKDIVAVDNGALAIEWHSPWRRPGYDFRKDHKERDEKLYAIRGNWALEKGLMKAGPAGYYDEITHVGEEVFCSCTGRYVFALRKLPPDMLTKAGMFALPAELGAQSLAMDETTAVADATITDVIGAVAAGTEAPIAPKAGPLGRAAGILFLTPEGETLLLRRGDGGDFPRTFGLPGGHVEEGETDEQAARRECLEETGYAHDGPLARLCSDGQFVTFVARGVEKFAVSICDESTGFVWCKPEEAPEPLHPGMSVAFRVAAARTELDVARLIRDGALPSPQVFGNSMLFALRITGTGQVFRWANEEQRKKDPKYIGEFAHRDESLYLTEEFLARCNGLPVVWQHPDGLKLDTVSYAESNVGTITLPYIDHERAEVWGIARILDLVAGAKMAHPDETWSTSPGVVFDGASGSVKVPLDGGTSILIEGNPYLIDHLAICERGVWDKEGPSEGVQVDQPIEVKMPDLNANAADATKTDTAVADAQPSLSEIMAAVKGLVGSVGVIGSRLDTVEKNMPAPTLNAAADARKDADEQARKDAAEEQAKKDAAAEEQAKKDAFEKAEKDAAECAKKDAEEAEAMADSQARADSVYQMHGLTAPAKIPGERLLGYRTRLLRKLQSFSPAWKGADLSAITDSVALKIAEETILADAARASHSVVLDSAAPRLPRAVRRRDENTGHNITTFVGPAGGWMDDFRAPSRGLIKFNTKGDQQ